MGLESNTLYFVLVFPRADLDVPAYMELPAGIENKGAKHVKQHVLLLEKYIYGLKQASANQYDTEGRPADERFHESVAKPCVFLKGSNEKTVSKLNSSRFTFCL